MSDEGREVDIDSGEEEGEENVRAHHAALERHRRDQIKDAFSRLSEAVPTISDGEKRARILSKASVYISTTRKKNASNQREIEMLRTQNSQLESQIRALEAATGKGEFETPEEVLVANGLNFVVGTAEDAAAAARTAAEAEEMAAMAPVRTIQPGQSLLIMANNGEPQRKKRRS